MLRRALAGGVMLCLGLGPIPVPARAGQLELFAGAWNYGLGGQITEGSSAISLDHDQGIQVSTQAQAFLRYRLSSPWDFGLGYQHLGAAGSYIAPSNLQFGNIVVVKDQTTVQAGVNFNSFDGSVHYRLTPWQHAQLGLGLELKYLNGHYTVAGINTPSLIGIGLGQIPVIQQQRSSVAKLVPLPHAALDYNPWRRLRLSAAGGYVALAGNHVGEWRVSADLQVFKPVSLTAGYFAQLYRVKSSPTIVDARVGGPMAGITIHTW
jgi:hypothetical protein